MNPRETGRGFREPLPGPPARQHPPQRLHPPAILAHELVEPERVLGAQVAQLGTDDRAHR
jgi:hypothetical protein